MRFVSAAEFCALATSRRKLHRVDDPAAGLRGLLDPETDTRFVVDSRELEAYAEAPDR